VEEVRRGRRSAAGSAPRARSSSRRAIAGAVESSRAPRADQGIEDLVQSLRHQRELAVRGESVVLAPSCRLERLRRGS
jgi:hypothetical protein